VYVGSIELRVLTWNLMHGRAVPRAGRDLRDAFTAALDSWEWDVALLQEVPPWWPPALAAELDAEARWALTSRNAGLALRRAIATRAPDLIKSHGGSANTILVRAPRPIVEHRARLLRRWPERRRLHAVRLISGQWVGNLHASVDARAAAAEARAAAAMLDAWAAGAPAVLGGDFNVRGLQLAGYARVAAAEVDYVFAGAGLRAGGPPARLARGRLSDHAPLAVTLEPARAPVPACRPRPPSRPPRRPARPPHLPPAGGRGSVGRRAKTGDGEDA
jgi:endonuclease/exonuclease/phosphatase family metal-dependent hydrolase